MNVSLSSPPEPRALDAVTLKRSDIEAKIAAARRMAGGLTRDFHELAGTILGHTDRLLASFVAGDPRAADVVALREAVDSTVALTNDLLAFSAAHELQPVPFDLRE